MNNRQMEVLVVAAVMTFAVAVCAWLAVTHSERVSKVEACEKRGGVAVIAARADYACLLPEGVLR